ncbi:hypothetical protein [Achromobacter arsenitoxydans]|uniref:Lipoprotein n=1 Tax=Achromobacter arsenitoxydans SY8 TaxID=477184 RepID=H0FE68_9BURK|nr:hypothetical protein [Achromobacter arsenitoxydans]EHK63442.1 hypothetical protein KYC_25398 [Achromobacter arsenitoxydans SY8]
MMGRLRMAAAIACLAGLAAACASNAPIRTVFVPVVAGEAAPAMTLSRDVVVTLADGADQTLPEGSRWRRVGALVQGDVYRRIDAPMSMGKADGPQAYLVASSGRLVGFYLPAGGLFAPVPKPAVLPFSQRQ